MALTLGQSHASTHKSLQYLNETRAEIEKSQLRLASGRKIVSPGDDVGGLAVSMKLEHQLTTTNALASNVANANSYAEMQYTTVESAYNILTEMRELYGKYSAASGNSEEQGVYQSTFDHLADQLVRLSTETVNGVNLFGEEFSVSTTLTGENSVNMEAIDFGADAAGTGVDPTDLVGASFANNETGEDVPTVLTTKLDDYIDKMSSYMIQASADQSTLGFASDYLANMATSLESAHGRIMDVDIAEETINLSKLQVQQEAALAAIVQANLAMESVLKLLISRDD
jgi:flagellin